MGYCGVFCVLCVRGVCARGGVRGTVGAPLDSITLFASGGTLRKILLVSPVAFPQELLCVSYFFHFIKLIIVSIINITIIITIIVNIIIIIVIITVIII